LDNKIILIIRKFRLKIKIKYKFLNITIFINNIKIVQNLFLINKDVNEAGQFRQFLCYKIEFVNLIIYQ